jgi:ketosteroid isomerase-like protein
MKTNLIGNMINKKTCIWRIGAIAILITSQSAGHTQPMIRKGREEEGTKIKAELEAINRRMEFNYLKENADSILSFYDRKITYLPEYKPAIYGAGDLQKFYTDWFHSVHIKAYSKKIYEVENIAGYVLEIGNFLLSYSTRPNAEIHYTGKYMIMWKRDLSGKLKILSDAFGSDKYINAEDMPYASVEVKETRVLEENIVSRKLLPEIEEFDKAVVKAVLAGDGEGRANEFTKDGIYMPHFDPMQVGMDMIKPYMLKTYQPGVIKFVKDTYREIFDQGEFVFLNGHFKVSFDNGINKGSFEGNMSNLMKRGKNGKLLMYRQLAHN